MAAGDYYSCDVCGGKAFYDANLSYDFDNEQPRVEYGCGMKLGYVGDMACICDECAKTHKVEIVATSSKASADGGSIGDDRGFMDTLERYNIATCKTKDLVAYIDRWIAARPAVGMVAAPDAIGMAWAKELVKALKRLSFAAQTTGGTAGRDAELVAAIKQAEDAMSYSAASRAIDLVEAPAAPDMSVRDAARVRELECVIVDLKSECRNARDEALEEAAEHVEAMIDNIGDAASYDNREMYDSEMMTMHAHTEIAKRIRALRSAPIGADQGVKDA